MKLTDKFIRFIKVATLSVPFMFCLSACQDDWLADADEVPRQDNLPVELNMDIQGLETRGPSFFKKEFEANDVVHVQGTFNLSDGSKVIKYAAMRYDGEKWSQYNGATGTGDVQRFTWPNNAIDADFNAYYIYGSNSLMVPTDDPEEITPTTLTEIIGTSTTNPDKDPLKASTLNVKYGHTINLDFIHACAYLTVEELPAGVSSVFWFTREEAGGNAPEDFKNAFRLYLTSDNQLNFEFVQAPDPEYGDKVYIQGTTKTALMDGFEKSSAGFFLAPGQYLNFVVGYPGSNQMVNYISYSKEFTPTAPDGPDDGNTGGDAEGGGDDIEGGTPNAPLNPNNELVENGVYTFNVSKSSGVKIEHTPEQEEWDETDDPIYDVDAEAFLWAVCKNEDYYVGNVQIIKPEGTTSRLLHNVNMQWAQYNVFAPSEINNYSWFEPNLGQGVTFEGGGHYIWNLGSPLFLTVDGTVRHLGLANAKINVVTMDEYYPGSTDTDDPDNPDDSGDNGSTLFPNVGPYDLSRQGAICGYLNNGTIENIRIKTGIPTWDNEGKYEDVFILNAKVWGVDSQESHNIGTLVGSNNNGTVNGINIFCDMSLNVSNYTGTNGEIESHVPRVYIGGIIGQNVNEVHNILSGTGNNKITINNSCYYERASFSIGGLVGIFSGGTMNNVVLPSVTIDSRRSSGFTAYLGGAAGRLSNVDNGGKFFDISVAGTVYAGKSEANEGNNGTVYTGGLVGECYESYEVSGCYTGVSVYGPYTNGNYDNYVGDGTVNYATGGMFGCINNLPGDTPNKFVNDIAMGKEVRGPVNYIGSFAGLVPRGETWEDNYQGRDLLIQNNLQNNGQQLQPIGGNQQ